MDMDLFILDRGLLDHVQRHEIASQIGILNSRQGFHDMFFIEFHGVLFIGSRQWKGMNGHCFP